MAHHLHGDDIGRAPIEIGEGDVAEPLDRLDRAPAASWQPGGAGGASRDDLHRLGPHAQGHASPAGASMRARALIAAAARIEPDRRPPAAGTDDLAGSKFILGEPMKPATNRLLGRA